MNTGLCEWAYLWEINVFFRVCARVCVHICMHVRIKMDISQCYKTPNDAPFSDLPPIFVDFCIFHRMIFRCNRRCHKVNSIRGEISRGVLICAFASDCQLWETTAARPSGRRLFSRNLLVSRWPLTFSAVLIPSAANVMARVAAVALSWTSASFHCPHQPRRPSPHLAPTKPDKWFRFVLCSPGKKLSIQSAKWCQGFVSKAYEWQKHPTSFQTPPKKTPLLQAKKIESQDTLLISSPCILTLTFLNRSSSYKGQSSSFCVLKCG